MKLKKLAFSLVLLLSFLAQIVLQFNHAISEHENEHFCYNHDIQNICDHDNDSHEHYFELFSYVLIGHCDCFGFDGMKCNHTELVMSLYRRVTFSHTQHAKIGFLFS